jgi:hypothetical protein
LPAKKYNGNIRSATEKACSSLLPRLIDKGRTSPECFHLQLMGYAPVKQTKGAPEMHQRHRTITGAIQREGRLPQRRPVLSNAAGGEELFTVSIPIRPKPGIAI